MSATVVSPAEVRDGNRTTAVASRSGRLRRVWRGRADDAPWVRPALLALLVATAGLYLWGLGASGWANSFYTAAVQAGTKSWKAFFFGSFDASNFITVDKSPGALWVMEISARIFGLNSWSLLVPQALEGVGTVGLLYLTVRRWFSPAAALTAGLVAAITPVAALMFRFNNPDALMVLLLTGAAYATVRGIEDGRARWMLTAGSLIGFAFLAKMLEAFLIVPAVGLAYVVAARGTLPHRIRQLLYGLAAMLVSAGWWVLTVQLIPAADRPYIGGSQDNSLWNLIFGYNGFGRLSGNETGSVGGQAGGGGQWGPTGLTRLFGAEMGTQISWLLPAALGLLAVGLVVTWRTGRRNRTRAALLLWGGWLVVTGLAFSLGRGIIHPYYTVALAPAIGAVVGIGGSILWSRRQHWAARAGMAAAVLVTAVWSDVLLDRTPDWLPWLRPVIIGAGAMAAVGLMLWPLVRGRFRMLIAAGSIVACLAGPLAYTLDTVNTAHSGAIPTAGPAGGSTGAGPGGRGGFAGAGRGTAAGGATRAAGATGAGRATGGGFAGGGAGAGARPGIGIPGSAGSGQAAANGGFRPGAGGGAAGGGLLNASEPSKALTALLKKDSSHYTWVAATVGANEAAGYQLATGDPVMAIGGFNGTDPYPTLAEFEVLVHEGKVHYFIAGGMAGPEEAGKARRRRPSLPG